MTDASPEASEAPEREKLRSSWAHRLVPWVITIACFGYLYSRIAGEAGRKGLSAGAYLAEIFASVDWTAWLALMVPYSFFYFLIDTLILWRVLAWFNTRVPYRDLFPVRASTYIISILNEQVGKGAIALYLNRRDGVPAWQVGGCMLFIMFCEFYYLLTWALVGSTVSWDRVPEIFHGIPIVAVAAGIVFVTVVYLFRSERMSGFALRKRQIFTAFQQADWWQYLTVIVLRSPALLAAVWVYSKAAALFGVEIGLIEMLGVLPVIFFGTLIPGPFRAAAVTLWPTLFPGNEGQMTAFGFVQHNFFVLFNAGIGLLFLRRANRELFGK
ncbi:MAG: hypothetical protein JRH01_14700 [Deltaproteobacteria bacterium]|nr:hypothetical protein [Deltaproteobacteria bacterium]MBW2393940.1 hypothetical protein [Deltaproteobacteria bacterium]